MYDRTTDAGGRRATRNQRQAVARRRIAVMIDTLEQRRLLAAFTVDLAGPETGANYHTISAAVAAAAGTAETDDTIDVAAGAFAETVVVNTPVTIRGAQHGVDARTTRPGGESILTGNFSVSAAGVTIDGFTILNGAAVGSPPTVSAVFINAAGATIRDNVLTGNAGAGTGVSVSSAIASGTTTLTQNVVSGFATGLSVRAGGAASITDNVVRANSVTGISFRLTQSTAASSVTVSNNAFDNAGVPQITLAGGTDGQDLVTLADSTVTLRGAAVYISRATPTPVAGVSAAAFTLERSTNEDAPLSIDLDVDGTGFGTYNHASLAGGASADGSIVTYVPTANFNGTTGFDFTTLGGATGTVHIVVIPVNDPPTVDATTATQSATAGQTTTIQLADRFHDADALDAPPDTLAYSLTGAPSFVTVVPETGALTFAPPAGLSAVGTYTFTVAATDGDASVSQTITLTVHRASNRAPAFGNLPATISLAENATGTVATITATDPEGDAIAYSIVGGNGAGKFAIDPVTGVVSLAGALDAETTQAYTLTIRATDNGEPAIAFAEQALTVNVTDVNEASGSVTINGPTGAFQGATLNYNAIALDPDVGASFSYQWFVDGVAQSNQTSSIFSISFPSAGEHTIGVTVVDRAGTPVSASKALSVADAPPSIPLSLSASTVNEAAPFTLTIGRIANPVTGDLAQIGQLMIDWGDQTYTVINSQKNPDLYAQVTAGTAIAPPHTYGDGTNAARTITVRVWDNAAHSTSVTTSIVVNNVAPTGSFVALTPTIQLGGIGLVDWFNQTDVSAADLTSGLRYTYAIDNNGNGRYDAGETLIEGDATYEGSTSESQDVQIDGTYFQTPGSYSILGLIFDKDSTPFLTQQASIVVTAAPLRVVSLGGDHSGFTVVFNQKFDQSTLNIYDGTDTAADASDIVVKNAAGQVIKGSVIFAADGLGFDFVDTGGILLAGNYTVTLRSSSSGFRDLNGGLLNGTGGGNFVQTFGVNAPPGPVLSMPDFTRGPGQVVDVVPGNVNSDLPVSVNTPIAISSINFQIRYNASLLTVRNPDAANGIADVVAGANLPAGWAVDYTVGTNVINVSLTKTSPSTPDIAVGSKELIRIRATVPNDPSIYGKSQYLSFAQIVINGNASIEGTADRAVHKVIFLGDANFDGAVNVADAALIQSVVLSSVNGFDKYGLFDPSLIVDSSRNGAVDSQDATNAVLTGFSGGRPADMPAFNAITLPGTLGADPTFTLGGPKAIKAGGSLSVPISVTDDARGVQAGSIRVIYDPTKLDLADVPFVVGSLLGSDFKVLTNVNEAQGYIEIAFYSGTALAGAIPVAGTLGTLSFGLAAGASDGTTPITIGTPTNLSNSPTVFFNRQGLQLVTSAVSTSITVDTTLPTVAGAATFAYAGPAQSISVTFSEDVRASVAAGDFLLTNLTTGAAVTLTLAGMSADGKTVTLTFANTGGLTNAILTDGNYRFRVLAGQVADIAGNAIFADSDSTFFFANGDATRDRTVGFDDLLVLAKHYGQSGATFADGDFNYDGVVGFDDLLILAKRYGSTLAAPPVAITAATRKRSDAAGSVIA